MKHFNYLLPLCFIAISALFIHCKKDSDKLDGEWNVTSWNEDGDEKMGDEYSSATLLFNPEDNEKGSFSWKVSASGINLELAGSYEMDAKENRISLKYVIGNPFTLDYDLSKEKIELSGSIDGVSTKIIAEKK